MLAAYWGKVPGDLIRRPQRRLASAANITPFTASRLFERVAADGLC